MEEFARYVESIGDKHIVVDVQNFTKEGGQLRLILDVKSYDYPELTRRWEVVADKLTGLHLDFQLAYEIKLTMNTLIVGDSYASGRFLSITAI
ncbi:hypothetical protein WL049_23040 [Vibrio alginolyticus]|uniref:hypothetical protein n=1 Tax=Vibrio harveyi group TaxID=717610 RepID=UPI0004A3A311|nr:MULTISPECIES: hypothetical protein [Vibrio harveyi group]OCP45551.1 hypothetical protein AKH06_12725 [Vibrio parahaemolyticus]HCM1140636.1 hypothetical protein [Vibrio parahaemolyticus]